MEKTGRKVEDKSNGSPPATLRGLDLFSAAMGPGVSGPPFRGAVGHPDLPRHLLQRPERRWAPRRRRRKGVGDGGGRVPGGHQQRQDGWLTKKKTKKTHPCRPSSLTRPETREETNEEEED